MANTRYTEAIHTVLILIFFKNFAGGNICCAPDQFEASLFYDNGNVFIDVGRLGTSYGYINGTIQISYDFTNHRVYENLTTVELSPLIPQPVKEHYEIISDYVKRVQYLFTGTYCQKTTLTDELVRECLPDEAVLLSSGFIGNNQTSVVTYMYSLPGVPITFTTTINPKTCLPAYMMYTTSDAEPDSGTLDSILVYNITPGIRNPAVFNPPSYCNSSTTDQQTNIPGSLAQKRARRLVSSFPYFSQRE